MSIFVQLHSVPNKDEQLASNVMAIRAGDLPPDSYELNCDGFSVLPGSPFAYWAHESAIDSFRRFNSYENNKRTVRHGLATSDDFRFVRVWWEVDPKSLKWKAFAKGGSYSPFYSPIFAVVSWEADGAEVKAEICRRYPYLDGKAEFVAKNTQFYMRPD